MKIIKDIEVGELDRKDSTKCDRLPVPLYQLIHTGHRREINDDSSLRGLDHMLHILSKMHYSNFLMSPVGNCTTYEGPHGH